MAFVFPELSKKMGVKPSETRITPLKQKNSAAAATAETFEIDLPRNKFIWAILLSIGEDTTATGTQGTLADDLVSMQLYGDGNKYMKKMLAGMSKEICKINREPQSTGFYKFYFKDPKLEETRPLPAWPFTSLTLEVLDNAPAASNYHHIRVSVIESNYAGEDLSHWPVLVEKYLRWKKFGTDTGEMEYEHDRAYEVYGYLYTMDEGGTLTDDLFDKLDLMGIYPEGEDHIVDKEYFAHIKELNKQAYMAQAMGTGYYYVEFPNGYPTSKYSTLRSMCNIPTAGTNIGLRVLERYVLS